MIPLGIVSSTGSSLVPLVSSISFTFSGAYGTSFNGYKTFSRNYSQGNYSAPHTDIEWIFNPITVTATLTGLPESGPGSTQPISGKDLTITFVTNNTSYSETETTDANGQITTTISPDWGNTNGYGWYLEIQASFLGQDTGQIIYPSSTNIISANFYTYNNDNDGNAVSPF